MTTANIALGRPAIRAPGRMRLLRDRLAEQIAGYGAPPPSGESENTDDKLDDAEVQAYVALMCAVHC